MGSKPTVFGLITARGGSKSIPGKNLVHLAGKPLIEWTIDAAKDSRLLDQVSVSTDDEGIASLCRSNGLELPFMRPAGLARDTSSHFEVVEHFLDTLECEPEYVLLLQPTSPLRTSRDIDSAIEMALKKDADAVVSVVESERHPAHIFRSRENGSLKPYYESDLPYWRRQDLPEAYALNGAIYLVKVSVFRSQKSLVPQNSLPYIMPVERSIDIDTKFDLDRVEAILKSKP